MGNLAGNLTGNLTGNLAGKLTAQRMPQELWLLMRLPGAAVWDSTPTQGCDFSPHQTSSSSSSSSKSMERRRRRARRIGAAILFFPARPPSGMGRAIAAIFGIGATGVGAGGAIAAIGAGGATGGAPPGGLGAGGAIIATGAGGAIAGIGPPGRQGCLGRHRCHRSSLLLPSPTATPPHRCTCLPGTARRRHREPLSRSLQTDHCK